VARDERRLRDVRQRRQRDVEQRDLDPLRPGRPRCSGRQDRRRCVQPGEEVDERGRPVFIGSPSRLGP
jgi:hypothetical protein